MTVVGNITDEDLRVVLDKVMKASKNALRNLAMICTDVEELYRQ